ncbi:Thaumatin [Parasponia andersonii]|uniref:Thaumatin n=1 Tax=Parasponia andersonii TaxID=3476 RepID=A0A2P5BXC5_PARAD|nr:Thaumatin [Parasponia andersonii]
MGLFSSYLILLLLMVSRGVSGATFTFINKCDYTVWPGTLSSAGSPKLDSTGFELQKGTPRSFQAPTGWSGRFWGRTGCSFDGSDRGSCATGDCGSGQMECNGAGATPPATLAEFTLGSGSQDFYDVSLVDGYNLPMVVEGSGGSSTCASTGCVTDLNRRCPTELRVDGGGACRSACEAFGSDEYCCSGAYNTPSACKPSLYSQIFKSACPKSYSYAYDDATSTFTCSGADYTITFCPTLPILKSSRDSSPMTTGTTISGSGSGSDAGADSGTIQQASLASSWLANLATGDSIRTQSPLAFDTTLVLVMALCLSFRHL